VIEAKPCPFCGKAEGLSFYDGDTYRWGIACCNSCGASAGETRREYPDEGKWHEEAVKQWNVRDGNS
jgi:Lar family restriction alleviation protein